MAGALAAVGIDRPCCVTEEAPAAALSFSKGHMRIDLRKSGRLARKDGAFRVVDLGKGVNLIVVHAKSGEYAALERSCTHGGAQVVFNSRNQTVQCTSWGHSEFSLDGRVLGGSARKPLKAYAIRREGDWLEVGL